MCRGILHTHRIHVWYVYLHFTIEINVTGDTYIPVPWILWVILPTQTLPFYSRELLAVFDPAKIGTLMTGLLYWLFKLPGRER